MNLIITASFDEGDPVINHVLHKTPMYNIPVVLF